ncbi:MAG: type II toxin-antitoxin system CcdA family antitoxin [Pseudomonadota bacterium]
MPTSQRRRSINLTISEDVIDTAKSLKLNASEAAEAGLREAIARRQAELWRAENRAAIDAHNARIARQGPLLTPGWVDDEA